VTRIAGDLVAKGDRTPRTGNRMLLAGLSRIAGYAGLEPSKRSRLSPTVHARLAGVGWVRRNETTQNIAGLVSHDDQWLAVPQPLARARLVGNLLSSDVYYALESLSLEDSAIVEPGTIADENSVSGPVGDCQMVSDRPGTIELNTNTKSRQLLVTTESFHDGWQALIDGLPVPVVRVTGIFWAVSSSRGSICAGCTFSQKAYGWGCLRQVVG